MSKLKLGLILSCSISTPVLILADKALADSFTISPGTTVNLTMSLITGEFGTVEEGGVIASTTGNGIEGTADGVIVNNAGSVTGGDFFSGLYVLGNSTITNSGSAIGGMGISVDGNNTSIVTSGITTGGNSGIYAEGDNNTFTNSGMVTGGDQGIISSGDRNSITNSGSVTSGVEVIVADGDHNWIINSGTTSGGLTGIQAHGNNNAVVNSGTSMGNGYAIYVYGDFSTVTNTGTASSLGNGIVAIGNGNTITNSATAEGGLYGIQSTGTENTITNSKDAKGVISGIYIDGAGNTITNTGTTTAELYGISTYGGYNTITNLGISAGSSDTGIAAFGDGNTIINSGRIISNSVAVRFDGSGNKLTLLSGSTVQGFLEIAGTGDNTLVIGGHLNTALAYSEGAAVSLDTSGRPFVSSNGVLAVVDPTLFSAEDDMLNDLTRSLANVVDARLWSAIGHKANNIGASTSNADTSGSQWATWATGIGHHRSQTADGIYDGFDTTLGGFALGSDGVLPSGTRFGGFVGASSVDLNTNFGAEQIHTGSSYAGLYAGYTMPNGFVNLAVTGGHTNAATNREVLNNMVAGGIEQAKGNPDGVFISPQATIGTDIEKGGSILTPSLRIAYTRLSMDSYAETGSTANLSVGSRSISIVDLRGQVAFAIKPIVTGTGQFDATMRLGADATVTNSDDITATLLGQPITLGISTQVKTVGGFAGLDLAQKLDNGANLKLSIEAGYDTDNAVTVNGTAGLAWAF
jgi:uncharacterized protein with beta-barrel porin domain